MFANTKKKQQKTHLQPDNIPDYATSMCIYPKKCVKKFRCYMECISDPPNLKVVCKCSLSPSLANLKFLIFSIK